MLRGSGISTLRTNIFLLISLFTIGVQFSGLTQTPVTDSLECALKISKSPDDKISVLLNLSQQFIAIDLPKAMGYAEEAYKIADDAGSDVGRLRCMLKLIWLNYIETEYSKALDYAIRSKELAEKLGMKLEIALAVDAMGTIYDDFGDKDKSSEYYFRSLKIYEELKDQRGMAQSSSRIGVSYYKQKNYPKALEYLLVSLDLSRRTNSMDGVASNLNSIANVYADQENYILALKNYQEALQIAVKNSDLRMEGSSSLNIGSTYLKMKNYPLSIQYLDRALTIFNKLKNQLRIAKCQVQVGEYCLATRDYRKGLEYAGEALDHSRKMGFMEVELSAAQLLRRLSLAMRDTLKAYNYAILESLIKDSLTSGEKQKSLTKLEAQYQFDKEQTRKTIAQQKKDYITIILIIILVSGIVILLLIWGRQKVKAKNAILRKESLEKELEFKNKEMVINVMSLMKKNEMLSDLSEKLMKIEGEAKTDESKDTIKKVAKELQKSQEEEILNEFSLRFKEVHGEFYNKLLEKFPSLSPSELKLCAFLRLNMSSKDIAALTGQRVSSLETARYRLRQKLGISNSEVNLITFLSQL